MRQDAGLPDKIAWSIFRWMTRASLRYVCLFRSASFDLISVKRVLRLGFGLRFRDGA